MTLIKLPIDVLIENILSWLDAMALIQMSKTCRFFHQLANDEVLWKRLVLSEFNLPPDASFRQSGWKSLYSRLNNPTVYTWGENFDGRLGHGVGRIGMRRFYNSRSVPEPRELVSLRNKGIVDIVAGGWSFHALDRYGHVWMWGTMQEDVPVTRSLGARPVREPVQLVLPPETKIRAISCGRSHAIALDYRGEVWHWNNLWRPQQVLLPSSSKAVQVTANWGYSSVLTEDGEIHVVPQPELIASFDETNAILPELVLDLPGVTLSTVIATSSLNTETAASSVAPDDSFVQLAGLEKYTLALTRLGRVFRLHTENRHMFTSSPLTDELVHFSASTPENNTRRGRMQRFVSGAFTNFAVYTADGQVMLGSQNKPPNQQPEIPPGLSHGICKVAFGDYHMGAVTNTGALLTWGAYSAGALGHGHDNEERQQDTPQQVEALKDMFVFAIGFGGWHSGVLAIPNHQ
ncbi:regulator of chromosome condensation 1/beta-lactamase-inhibitor protein II [Radiomyces spectabilis]|uniref:regulator of chromosome condensation 1/beta-lactamase-inhibitor protein II n=1 Tax=Radiomyces spectabilis TaxID=64574 RepID=UPI00221F95AC|nr:regulator of chromosome condensation 1/beta-lactamase-inhibitor protein II [Radiomyces spectabilis]KAI8367586.1 regulator of chromosome condensation 1/beta-lactamase-inhibitor protein II [Radiomyces spectabilis]